MTNIGFIEYSNEKIFKSWTTIQKRLIEYRFEFTNIEIN